MRLPSGTIWVGAALLVAWSCSSVTDDDDAGDSHAGETSHAGQAGHSAGGKASTTGRAGTGGSDGGGESGGDAGANAASDTGGVAGDASQVDPEGSGGVQGQGYCEDGVPIAPTPAGGAGGNGGAGDDPCVSRSLESLCSTPGRCPGFKGSDYGFSSGCLSENYGTQLCALAFPSSCGGESIRVEGDPAYDNTMTIWHFNATGELVGAVTHTKGGALPIDGCDIHFYGQQCIENGPAIDLCSFGEGSCPHSLSEMPIPIATVDDVPHAMFGGGFLNDCGGFTVELTGEHQGVSAYTFDADGMAVGMVDRGSSRLCADGSVRFGERYGEYCPPNRDQPYPCWRNGGGGCPN